MQKIVNGVLVDIGDVRIFEEAMRGLVMAKQAISNINITIDKESEIIKSCIDTYNRIYRSLPFPLYSIENDVKYAAMAECMRVYNPELKKYTFCILGGLNILVDSNKVLKIIGNDWCVEPVKFKIVENAVLKNYKDEVGYREFTWAVNKISKGKSLVSYYQEFMPEFLKACNGDPSILKYELANILNFEAFPSRIEFDDNVILDLDNGDWYSFDTYLVGKVANGNKIEAFSIAKGGGSIGIADEYLPTYGYTVFKKEVTYDDDLPDMTLYGKMTKVDNTEVFDSIFENIVRLGIKDNHVLDTTVIGFIKDGNIIYQIGDKIYKCSSVKYSRSVEIVHGVALYGIKDNTLYISRSNVDRNKVKKETIYSLDLRQGKIKICGIVFK